MTLQTIMGLAAIILPKKQVVGTPGNRNRKENLKCLLARSLSRREFTRTIKSTTENKNKGGDNNKKNKDEQSSKVKEAIKSRVLQVKTRIRRCGIKYSLSINLNPSPKNHQLPTNPPTIKSLKTKVLWQMEKTESTKNPG